MICSSVVMSAGLMTTICLHNTTQSAHHILIYDIDYYDWVGENRPDRNFNDLTIEPGATICRQEEINNSTTPHFTFAIDNNPTRMAAQNLGHAIDTIRQWGAYTDPANPTTVYGKKFYWKLASNWLEGSQCLEGPNCRLFELRSSPF